eukprot:scaffold5017_cov200-Pinguiococcus_pyrenoidosus.AAC.1
MRAETMVPSPDAGAHALAVIAIASAQVGRLSDAQLRAPQKSQGVGQPGRGSQCPRQRTWVGIRPASQT